MSKPNADVRFAVMEAIRSAEGKSMVLNAYQLAEKILESLPRSTVRLEDMIDMMVEMRGTFPAIEFTPPAAIIEVEIVLDSATSDTAEDIRLDQAGAMVGHA